ncbi:MAG: Zn-dependent hydrolase, partial [Verrucomicrobiia bacterium]
MKVDQGEVEDGAERAWERLEILGGLSDEAGRLTRVFGERGMAAAGQRVKEWMEEAGLHTARDGWGNVFGRTPGKEGLPVVVIGSHLDTVRDGGKYDGALGVVAAVEAVARVGREGWQGWPFAVEVAAFSDEEGARFQTTYLGSRAALGRIEAGDLERRDEQGVRVADLVPEGERRPNPRFVQGEVAAYLEVHIEQGPVLEAAGLSLGIVSEIAGQTRARVEFVGRAAHAGTCPMNLRRDALAGLAEWVLQVEAVGRARAGLVATVGWVEVDHGASNVVPGRAWATLDVRHGDNRVREEAVKELRDRAEEVARRRSLGMGMEVVQENGAVACDAGLRGILAESVREVQGQVLELVSGAGHDAVPMSGVAPVGMLLVRCRGGISHHPEESVLREDVGLAVKV